jgi:ZIP family zinc transporter
MYLKILIGILIPFLGTTLGALCVYFLQKKLNARLTNALNGFASGVMIAASIWSLLVPAMEYDSSLILG